MFEAFSQREQVTTPDRVRGRLSLENAVDAAAGSVAGKSLDRMLGHEAVTAGIAGPEIADDVIGKISRSFRSYHGVCANRTGR